MSALPVTLLKTWSVLTRGLLAFVLLLWLLFAVGWGTLHWLIVPRIGEFRPQMQAQAARALGVPVRIGAVLARSNGMMPLFELSDVALLDPQGQPALSLSRVLVSVSPRSLWRLGFEQIYIDQPVLDVRRHADGRISVAAMDVVDSGAASVQALDWFFSQRELVIANGRVRWHDDLRATPPLVLQSVDVVLRNSARQHAMRLDATPPPEWGDRFSLRGQFVQPLLERQNGRWQAWTGQVFAAFERVDVSQLNRFVALDFDLNQGMGAVRAWVDVKQSQWLGGVADIALAEVSVKLAPNLQALALQQVQGRLQLRLAADGFEFSTHGLAFATRDGLQWPGGNVRYLFSAAAGQPERAQLQADSLDLKTLAQIADRLPLPNAWRTQLMRYAPKGRIDSVLASWQGPLSAPTRYAAHGQLRQIALDAVDPLPGVQALDLDFDLDQNAGRARLAIARGSVDVPSILEERRLTLDQFSARASWQRRGEVWSVELADVQFANADVQGQASVKWYVDNALPGVLDLQATLSRADARQVHRYLPLVIDKAARDYVREAILGGSATNVHFVVKGALDQLPLVDTPTGAFRITVPISQARLAFLPRYLQNPEEPAWPVLRDISAEVVIDRSRLQVKVAHAQLGDSNALQVTRAQVAIDDLLHTTVAVDADFNGSLAEVLKTVQSSPLNALTAQALARAEGSGAADFTLKLALPISAMDKSTVQGSVQLRNNDFQLTPSVPRLTRAKGLVHYTEGGLTLNAVQGQLLGGQARLDGGLSFGSVGDDAPAIRITGSASAEGLRQMPELGLVARLARYLDGSSAYVAELAMRRGTPQLSITSTLQGMASHLPTPLRKEAAQRLPLRLQWGAPDAASTQGSAGAAFSQDRLSLSLERLAQVVFERDTLRTPARVKRGAISVGADALETLALPKQGVRAHVDVPQLDADAWSNVMAQLGLDASVSADRAAAGVDYLPETLALRAGSLVVGGREFRELVAGIDRDGDVWRANVDATELNGYLEYRPATQAMAANAASAGRVYARLARLTLAPSAASEVESLLDAQPTSIPALDVEVDAFELRGKSLGRLEVEAINTMAQRTNGAREWRLNKLNLSVPEATLTATGNWTRVNAQARALADTPNTGAPRRTVMNFKLDIFDGGKLLARLGMPDVIRRASGTIEGQAAWLGSPLRPDYPSLGGVFSVNVAAGQFLKAEPGLAKLLGVLSLQALPRRLTLDFRDVFSEGFSFDYLRGDVQVEQGIARTNNLQMKGVNAAVLMEGQADIEAETQDLKVVVVPEINAGTASLLATVINPAVGLGSFLAQWVLRRPLIDSATQEFHIDGSWADPQVTKVAPALVQPKETPP